MNLKSGFKIDRRINSNHENFESSRNRIRCGNWARCSGVDDVMPKKPPYRADTAFTPSDGKMLKLIPTKRGKYSPSLFIPLKNFSRFILFGDVKKK